MTDAEIAAERLTALLDAERENTVLRAEVSYLRACVPPTRPTDYGHEVWTAALVEAKKEGARSAVAERVAVTPEPCPVCKGKCCRDLDLGYRVVHMGAEVYTHDCDDCDDGTYEVCGDPEPFIRERTYEDGIAEGERRATAAVVAWLNAEAERADCGHVEDLADRIERGEHRREEER